MLLYIRDVGPETKELKVRLVEKNSKGERESLFSAYHQYFTQDYLLISDGLMNEKRLIFSILTVFVFIA